jgi:hypothetical protein
LKTRIEISIRVFLPGTIVILSEEKNFGLFNRSAARDVLLQANGVFALSLQRFNTSTDLKMTREHRQFA